jgi:exodeoxyribonuclease-5
MNDITLSDDQCSAYEVMAKWLANGGIVHPNQKSPNLLTFAGFAGTGKTTVTSKLAKSFSNSIRFAFCALSGRAASILGTKLRQQGFQFGKDDHYCGTIHSLIYRPIEDENTGEVICWARNPKIDYDIIVLDEASMISEDIFRDLSSYGIDILAVGDHGQLPPIGSKFSLMKDPILRLEKIHRQAQDNPIINLSMIIRETGEIPKSCSDNKHISFVKMRDAVDFIKQTYQCKQTPEELLDSAILCYRNSTRTRFNNMVRKFVFGSVSAIPLSNDLVICLRNVKNKNSKQPPMYNGYRGYFKSSVKEIDDHFWSGKIKFPYEDIEISANNICKHQFGYPKTFGLFDELAQFKMEVKSWNDVGLLFDYGYALTVHKFQGSQAPNVILFNERPVPVDDDTYRRWAYTASTRSSDKLTIIT